MKYGKKTKAKKTKSTRMPFKPCRGCPTPAACKRVKKCKGKK
jgi:hypothetical protein